MPWIELTVACRSRDEARIENALNELGALSVTLTVGETPLWAEIIVSALFDIETRTDLILHALESLAPMIDISQAQIRRVEDQDWQRAWMDQFKPMQFGQRTFIVPWDHKLPEQAMHENAAVIRLDPGLAFGSGTHPTTALCLEWLDSLDLNTKPVLDFGCGSGILAIAALKLGAHSAIGVDNDPQAIIATRDNAERNRVADQLTVYLPNEEIIRAYPIVIANILASALMELSSLLASRVEPHGLIALSGILRGQEQEILARYAEWFIDLECEFKEDWVRITGRRRS
jgi:ribosomal protein L11 methyltransferase